MKLSTQDRTSLLHDELILKHNERFTEASLRKLLHVQDSYPNMSEFSRFLKRAVARMNEEYNLDHQVVIMKRQKRAVFIRIVPEEQLLQKFHRADHEVFHHLYGSFQETKKWLPREEFLNVAKLQNNEFGIKYFKNHWLPTLVEEYSKRGVDLSISTTHNAKTVTGIEFQFTPQKERVLTKTASKSTSR